MASPVVTEMGTLPNVVTLLERHTAILSVEGDAANSHRVLRQDRWQVAATVSGFGLRLSSEAE